MSNRKRNENSSAAFRSLDPAQLSKTYSDIIFALQNMPDGGTWEQIAKVLKEKESRIWKRLNELGANNLIHRDGRRVLSSGRFGSIWKIGPEGAAATTEKSLPGPTIADHSRAIKKLAQPVNQPTLF
jgi:predicted transcriptional regulator